MKTKKEIITECIERVREEVPISEEIRLKVRLIKAGASYKGLCPFHNDKKLGSFIVTDGKKIFKCFSCGTGGDIIKYVYLDNDQKESYTKTGLDLGLKYGKISYEEYQYCVGSGISTKLNNDIEKIYIEKDKEKFKSNKADDETLNKIYSLFIKGFTYLGKTVLTPEHKNHLIDERHLTEEEIANRGYFTFPNRYVMKHFLNDLEENDIPVDVLSTIPGFFFDKKRNVWSFTAIKGGGIGIPMINEQGLIYGIQVRKDVIQEGDQRYIWFSSAFAQYTEGLDFGVSSGSPIDVVVPNVIGTQTIFVTEGHFKAQKLAKEFNSIAISVQGVCAWSPIVNMIDKVKAKYHDLNLSYIYIAYDGDMSYNTAVFQQAINMGISLHGLNHHGEEEALKECLNDEKNYKPKNIVYYCMWDDELGKGIDDLMFNGYGYKIDKMKLTDIYTLYKNYISELNELYVESGIYDELSKVPKKERKDLFENRILSQLPKYKNI